MIWILLGVLLFGGGGGEALRDAIRGWRDRVVEVVPDAERQERATASIDVLLEDLDAAVETLAAEEEALFAALRDRNAPASAIRAPLDRVDALRQQTQAAFLASRRVLRSELQPAEWEAVFAKGPK